MAIARQMPEAENAVFDFERACINKGMKMTEQRRVIARVLSDAHDHPDVETIYNRASKIDARISIATVYRTLRLFDIANIIDRHDFGDGRARYEVTDEQSAHHHLIDVKTGKVHEFENDEVDRFLNNIANGLGYKLVWTRLELFVTPTEGGDGHAD
jgi:Fur family ferric uptake transcriptional regulator